VVRRRLNLYCQLSVSSCILLVMLMYARMRVRDTVRVPPTRLGEDLNEVINDLLWEQFEGKLDLVKFL